MYSLYEYNQAGHMKVVKEEGIAIGEKRGIAIGEERGIKSTTALFSWLKANNRQDDIIRAIDDPEYLEELFEEYSREKHTY